MLPLESLVINRVGYRCGLTIMSVEDWQLSRRRVNDLLELSVVLPNSPFPGPAFQFLCFLIRERENVQLCRKSSYNGDLITNLYIDERWCDGNWWRSNNSLDRRILEIFPRVDIRRIEGERKKVIREMYYFCEIYFMVCARYNWLWGFGRIKEDFPARNGISWSIAAGCWHMGAETRIERCTTDDYGRSAACSSTCWGSPLVI